MMARRILAMCNADSAGSGGLVDFDVDICSQQQGSPEAIARSAVVSNIALIGLVVVLFTVIIALESHYKSISVGDAAATFCLPSSLLTVWVAVVPSITSAATLLLGRLKSSSCTTVDAVLGVLGLLTSIVPVAGILFVWYTRSRGEAAEWRCVHYRSPSFGASLFRLGLKGLSRHFFERSWRWESALSSVRRVLLQQRAWLLSSLGISFVAVWSRRCIGSRFGHMLRDNQRFKPTEQSDV
ncbi:membrane-associated protein, putative [Bodo saltans]|uniref:Membrane-associated protein, putative n=1 Tax=Bodo saltans TaxID=75058 RepID=A0A0S4J0U0_BODSA|nr:membrane-associated protein, putative [Bodo saltans]|eukprot:CUG06549.1 membrane-associated protein, putative [Bodo saltans]